MAIRTIQKPDIYLTAAELECLRREWEVAQQYTTMPQSFETWLRGRLAPKATHAAGDWISTMTDHQRPEALRLADWLDADACDLQTPRAAAAELRRLHAESTEQSRLLGMSAERELALRARVQELEKARQRAADAIRAGAKEAGS